MPAIYAHYSFGRQVFRQLDPQLRKIISTYKTEFRTGLQGPDFLFFYNPLKANDMSRLGSEIHSRKASVFLKHALKILSITGMDSPEGAYIMGFICHFILDSSVHSYIDEMAAAKGKNHTLQETEFDRYMMKRDGFDPIRYPVHKLVDHSRDLAATVTVFYEGTSTVSVWQCLRFMHETKKILRVGGPVSQTAKLSVVNLALGKGDEHVDHLMKIKEDPGCIPICLELAERFDRAIPECAAEIEGFCRTVRGEEKLSGRFYRNFT